MTIDDELTIRQGWDEKTVLVRVLSEQRRAAPVAEMLYQESEESIEKRKLNAEQRKATGEHIAPRGRPSKKNRRLIHQFRENNSG